MLDGGLLVLKDEVQVEEVEVGLGPVLKVDLEGAVLSGGAKPCTSCFLCPRLNKFRGGGRARAGHPGSRGLPDAAIVICTPPRWALVRHRSQSRSEKPSMFG